MNAAGSGARGRTFVLGRSAAVTPTQAVVPPFRDNLVVGRKKPRVFSR